MTQSRSQSQPTAVAPVAQPMAMSMGGFLIVPFAVMMPCFALPTAAFAGFPAAPAPTSPSPLAAAAAAPPPTPSTAPPPAPARPPPGPFFANEVFSAPPAEPLSPVEEAVAAAEWYAITRGRFVGVVDQYALSDVAISGVGGAARKTYTTQAQALDAFNRALTWGGVQVV
ncbi:hypothetical protein C8F04DRAFT_1275022 [Mycena alexandri]|uniref:Uncharacterized protein n=1 Tax=Mycena alexandri TaxID=1745969 RepID=A0AAD6WN09_9AGAR|nr:hypothetical protein C8F04DRAFT_1275022 [Mycena alexandri]